MGAAILKRGRPVPRAVWAFLAVYCAFAAVFSALAVWSVTRQARAVETTAVIISANEVRHLNIVRFVNNAGRTCESQIYYNLAAHNKHVGDEVRVRYPLTPECANVRAADDRTWWLYVLIAPGLLLVGIIVAVLLRRLTRPSTA
jgi:hypothetical protein